MRSYYSRSLKIGHDRLITVNQLVDIVAAAAGKTIYRQHDLTKPQGVRGRNSDNTRCREVLGWPPRASLEDGLAKTYHRIRSELIKAGRIQPEAELSAD